MKMQPFSLVLALALPSTSLAENGTTEMNLLRGRLEKQMAEILAIDAEIQSLSSRLGREATPLPRREPDRPAPEPAPLPVEPTPPTPPAPAPAPNPSVEVRPAVPVEEAAPPTVPTPPAPEPAPPPIPSPDVATNTQATPAPPPPVAPPAPVTPVPPPPTPPVVTVEPPAPPPPVPMPPAPPVERIPEPAPPAVAANSGEVVVQSGDTLSAIARKNKTTVAELMKANPGLVPEKLRPGQKLKLSGNATGNVAATPVPPADPVRTEPVAPVTPAAPVASGSYVVQSGDTMHSIARRAGTTVDALCRLNGIANPSTIQIGMKLKLPDGASVAAPAPSTQPTEPAKPRPPTPGTHIVKPGDTLSSISRQTNTPIEELRKVNNLKDDVIHPGQSLKVRRGGGGESAPAAPSGNNGASTRPGAKPATAQGVEMAEYTVHLGDSIFSISKRYFLSREEVAAMNSLPVDAPLQEGQKIRLPASALIAARLTESESRGN